MASAPIDPKAVAFQQYIQDKKILIADPGSTARTSLASTLIKLGAKTTNIAMAGTMPEAQAEMDRIKAQVVITDYDLGGGRGLELLQSRRKHHPESKSCLFVIVTGNTSQTAVAKAAEEDVDVYVIKPFTADSLRNTLIKATLAKINPTDYQKKIEEGKELLAQGKPDEAIEIFQEAKELDSAPSLACFYEGQANLMKEALKVAEGSYAQGLDYNKIHYKCMVGLFELLYNQKKFNEAYDIVKKISQYFPANPERLTQVMRLAIMTKSYEDVEKYYQAFTKIDDRNEDVIKYVCAGLVVCGKYYLRQSVPSRAIELFRKAAVTAGSRLQLLKEIILSLLEFDMAKEAVEFLKRFPPTAQNSEMYLSLEVAVMEKTPDQAIAHVVNRARDLLKLGMTDQLIYEVVIRSSARAGFDDSALNFVDLASKTYPNQKTFFESLYQENRRSSQKATSATTPTPKN